MIYNHIQMTITELLTYVVHIQMTITELLTYVVHVVWVLGGFKMYIFQNLMQCSIHLNS